MSDSVRHPSHYNLDGLKGVESIDIIKAVLGSEGFKKFCRGNALKYLIRADKKNGLEDLKKAAVYLNWEINGRTEDTDDEKTAEAAEKKEAQPEKRDDAAEAVSAPEESAESSRPEKEETVQELPETEESELPEEQGADGPREDFHRRAEELAEQHFARRGRSATWDVEKAKELWAIGTSPEDICDEIGVNPKTFKTYRFRHPEAFPGEA